MPPWHTQPTLPPMEYFGNYRVDQKPFELLQRSVLITQLCPTLWDPMDCSSPGSSVHGISQARILEWVVTPFSGRSLPTPPPLPEDQTQVSCALQADSILSEPPGKPFTYKLMGKPKLLGQSSKAHFALFTKDLRFRIKNTLMFMIYSGLENTLWRFQKHFQIKHPLRFRR